MLKLGRKLNDLADGNRPAVAITIGLVGLLLVGGTLLDSKHTSDFKRQTAHNPVVAAYEKQLPALAENVRKKADDPKARQDYAVALYASGNLEKAKEQYEAGIKLAPDNATLRNNLGNTCRDLGDYEKAVASFRKSIELDPKQATAYTNLAHIYFYMLDKKDLAIQTYEDGLAHSPDNEDMQVLLGVAYEQSGDKDRAWQTLQAVLDKNAQNQAAQAGIKRVQ